MRFAVRRPGIPEASPRSHRVSHGDVPCRVDVSVEREVAGHAGEESLALATLRCNVPTRRASLARKRGFNLLYPAGRLGCQAPYQQTPTGPQDSPVQPGLLTDVPARGYGSTPSRAGHAVDAEIFDSDHIEPTRNIRSELFGPVFARVRLPSLEAGNGLLHLGAAARAALRSRQFALKQVEPALPSRPEPGNAHQFACGQRCTDRDAAINAHCRARTGPGNWLGDQGERDMPPACPVSSHPVGLRHGHGAGPAEPYPTCFRDPHLACPTAWPPHMLRLHRYDTETLIALGFPPCRPAVCSSEEIRHGLGKVAQCLLLNHLGAFAQPGERSAGGGELAALLYIARGTAASGPPPGLLLYRKVPNKPRLCAMISQHPLLKGRWDEAIPGHANTIANTADISREVKWRSFPGLKARVSTLRR